MAACAYRHLEGRATVLLRFVLLGAAAYLPIGRAFAPVSVRLGGNADLFDSGRLNRFTLCKTKIQCGPSEPNENVLSRIKSHIQSQTGTGGSEPSKGDADGSRRNFMAHAGKLLTTLPLLSTTTTVSAATVEGTVTRVLFSMALSTCSSLPPKERCRENGCVFIFLLRVQNLAQRCLHPFLFAMNTPP
jgi:hypothetical protein